MPLNIPYDLVKAYFDKEAGCYSFFSPSGEQLKCLISSSVSTAVDEMPKATIYLIVEVVNEKPVKK